MSRRKFEPTPQLRKTVLAMSGYGIPHDGIALTVANPETGKPITAKTLRLHFRHELDTGHIVANAKVLADSLISQGVDVLTRGTDNHLIVFSVCEKYGITGRQAELALRQAGMTVNRNSIPFDPNGAWFTSGVRLGTPALTTLGMGEMEMKQIGLCIHDLLSVCKPKMTEKGKSRSEVEVDSQVLERVKLQTADLLGKFPLYPELEID